MVYFRAWQGQILRQLSEALQSAVATVNPVAATANGTPAENLTRLLETAAKRIGRDLLIILDQFEEYFLYHQNDSRGNSFARQFAEAANASFLPASFLISLRDDALSLLDRFKPLIPNLFSNYLRLDPLSAMQREVPSPSRWQPITSCRPTRERGRHRPRSMWICWTR